jgi:hypothetical protein
MGKPVRKEKKLLLSGNAESRVLLLISIGQDVLVRQSRSIGSCGTHSHPSSVLKGKPSEDGDSSREGFCSRGNR